MSSTSITCTTPAGSAGPATVRVIDTGGGSASLAGGFTYGPCSTISLVQSVPSGDQQNIIVDQPQTSQTISQTAGNLLVATAYSWNYLGHSQQVITDTLGNTWYAAPMQGQAGSSMIQMFYAQNIPGGSNTVTLSSWPYTPGAYNWTGLILTEYSGAALSDVVDASMGRAASAVSTATTGNLTATSSCRELVVSAYYDGTGWGSASTVSSGWTARAIDDQGAALVADNLPAGIFQSSGISATFTGPGNVSGDAWSTTEVAFRANGSATPPQPDHLAILTGAQSLSNTWDCSGALTIQAQNSSNQPVNVSTPLTVSLGGTGLTYYLDDDCENPITSTQILAGVSTQTVYFAGSSNSGQSAVVSSSGLTSATQGQSVGVIRPFTWIGGASCDGTWSTAACWQGGSVPDSGQVAHFDGNCTTHCDATLGADTSVGGVALHETFTHTLSLGTHNLSVLNSGGGDFIVRSGTFDAGSGTFEVQADFEMSGGTVSLSTASSVFDGGLSVTGGNIALRGAVHVHGDYAVYGGTFDASGSTLFFDSPGSCNARFGLTPGNVVYNHVSFLDVGSCGGFERALAYGQAMTVNGTLVLGGTNTLGWLPTLTGGTILAKGGVRIQDSGYLGTTELKIGGTASQLVDATSAVVAHVPALTFASTGGTVTFKGTPTVFSNLLFTSGTLDFTTNNATLAFESTGYCNVRWTLDPGTGAFGNVAFLDNNTCGGLERRIPANASMNVTGNLTLAAQINGGGVPEINGGTISVQKDVIVDQMGYRGDATINLVGSSNRLFDVTPATEAHVPSLRFAMSGGTVSFKGQPLVFAHFTHVSGTLDFQTYPSGLAFQSTYWCNTEWSLDPGTAQYGDVSFLDIGGCGGLARRLPPSANMDVRGKLILDGAMAGGDHPYLYGGTISVQGDVAPLDLGYFGDTVIRLSGSSQVLDGSDGVDAVLPALQFASSGTVKIKGMPTVSGNFSFASGTLDFATWGGTLAFSDTYSCNSNWSLDPGAGVYGNVSFLEYSYCGGRSRTFAANSTMTVTGTLTMASDKSSGGEVPALFDGTIDVKGNVVVQNIGSIGTTHVSLSGSSQLLDSSSTAGARIPGLVVASTGTVTFKGAPTVYGDYVYASGTLDFATFAAKLAFQGNGSCNSNWAFDPGTVVYGDVEFQDFSDCGALMRTFASGATMKVSGTLKFATSSGNGSPPELSGGAFDARGDVVYENDGIRAYTTSMLFSGATARTLSITGDPYFVGGDVTISKAGGSLSATGDIYFDHAGQNASITGGTLFLNGHNLTVDANLTVGAGATITKGGGTLNYGSLTNNGTIN